MRTVFLFKNRNRRIMNTFFYKINNALPIFPLGMLKRLSGQRTIYPFYHTVSDNDIIHIKNLYPIRTVRQFEKDLDFFLKHYTPLDVTDLVKSVRNKTDLKKDSFLLTFDDGMVEFHDVIAPILLKKGIPSLCFLNSGFVDNKDLFYRCKASVLMEKLKNKEYGTKDIKLISEWFNSKNLKLTPTFESLLSIRYKNKHFLDELADIIGLSFNEYLVKYKPYLTSQHIKYLIKKGFSFGSHSIDHPQYSDIDLNEQLFQTMESMDFVRSNFGFPYRFFSFPFTDHMVSKDFFNALYQKKDKTVDITFGCAGLKKSNDRRNIQRIPIEINDFTAKDIVCGEHMYFVLKALLNKNQIRRK